MTRVFISSTSTDLKDHRAAVRDAVLELGMHPVMMEHFPAMDADAIAACRQKVLDCDLFVGIYAHRYGYIPAGETRSITEMEYDWATETGLPCRLFMVDKHYDWPSEHVESGEAPGKLVEFRKKIGGKRVWKQFTTPDSLKAAVSISLSYDLERISKEKRHQRQQSMGVSSVIVLLLLIIFGAIMLSDYRREQRENDQLTQTAVAALHATETAIAPTPMVSSPAEKEETLVVIAQFEKCPTCSDPQRSIRDEIETLVPGVKVISLEQPITGNSLDSERAEAQRILDTYNATLIIYGYVEAGGVSVSYEITPRRSYVETEIEGRFRLSAAEIENFDVYLFGGLDAPYITSLTVGQLFYFEGNFEAALKSFDQAVDRVPADREQEMAAANLFFYRGNILISQRNNTAAIADYSHAIALDPNYVKAYNNRAIAYYSRGNYDHAIADFARAIDLDPNDAKVFNNRGNAYFNRRDYDHAIADYTHAIDLDPNDAKVYNNRGLAYLNRRDYDHAIADFDHAIALAPNFADAYSNRGIAFYARGDYGYAIADFDHAIALAPNFADAYNNRGLAYLNQGGYDLAITDFDHALALAPNFAAAYYNRGLAYKNLENYDAATADFIRAIKLDPTLANNPTVQEILALQGGE